MEITLASLTSKLLQLPRRARIQYLYIYCDRALPLFFTKGSALIMNSLVPIEKTVFKIMGDASTIADKYSFSPNLYTRKDLEWAKDAASSLEGKAFAYTSGGGAFVVANAFEELMNCCIDDFTKTGGDCYSKCLMYCYASLSVACSEKGLIQLNHRMDHDLDLFLAAMKDQHWTEDSPPRGASVMPGWGPEGAPDGWPIMSDVKMWASNLIEFAVSSPFKLVTKLFK